MMGLIGVFGHAWPDTSSRQKSSLDAYGSDLTLGYHEERHVRSLSGGVGACMSRAGTSTFGQVSCASSRHLGTSAGESDR